MADKITDKELKICAIRWLEKNAAVVGRYGNEPVYAEFILAHIAELDKEISDGLWREALADARVAELEAALKQNCPWHHLLKEAE